MSERSNGIFGEDSRIVKLRETERHRLLASEQRRATLDLIEKRAVPIELEELAAGIAGRQDGTTTPTRKTVGRVAAALHHKHLPMMNDYGVIDYDPVAKRIDVVRIPADLLTR